MRITFVKTAALATCSALMTVACGDDPAAPPTPVASVTLNVTVDTLRTGTTVQLIATPLDANGNPLTGRQAGWLSSNPMIATVAGDGTVTGVAPGTATISVTIEGQNASADVSVWRGVTGSWSGSFDLMGTCPFDMSLTEGATGIVTGTGDLFGPVCIIATFTITGSNDVGGVADSVEMTWDFGGFMVMFAGTFDGDSDLMGLLNGGGCTNCVTMATRSSIAPVIINSRARVGQGEAPARSLNRY